MKVVPSDKYADREAYKKQLIANITRWVAIAIAFGSTFFFFIKLLFL